MNIKRKMKKNKKNKKLAALKSEEAMIAGIIDGSPDAIGVAVVRLECGCRKMAALDENGDPASKVIIYRDSSEEICTKCKEDNGDFSRVIEEFIHWTKDDMEEDARQKILVKVFGSHTAH